MKDQATLTNSERSSCGGTECGGDAPAVRPAYRVEPRETGVSLHIALPGVQKEQTTLAVEEGILKIRATRSSHVPEEWSVHQAQPLASRYELRLRLHRDLDPATVAAELRDGVLSLAIERRRETLPRTIEIN